MDRLAFSAKHRVTPFSARTAFRLDLAKTKVSRPVYTSLHPILQRTLTAVPSISTPAALPASLLHATCLSMRPLRCPTNAARLAPTSDLHTQDTAFSLVSAMSCPRESSSPTLYTARTGRACAWAPARATSRPFSGHLRRPPGPRRGSGRDAHGIVDESMFTQMRAKILHPPVQSLANCSLAMISLRISLVPAPISYSLASLKRRSAG